MPSTRTAGSLEEKLYGLIIGRLDADRLGDGVYREKMYRLARKGICGFIIFGGEKDEIRSFIEEAVAIPAMPLFMASDVERGIGQQIRGTTSFPCQMALAAAVDRSKPGDIAILRGVANAIADEANDLGLNMPLIPVLDVNREPDNPIICTRAFSDDPQSVAFFGSEYISALEGAGLVSCAKHFPGHGDTTVDSHISLPVIHKSFRDLSETDIFPFRTAIHRGGSSIMVGHLSIPAIDTRPASLSEKIITRLLREELGFQGLVLTDALNMDALREFGSAPAECLNAGADILLHPADPDVTVRELMTAVESGYVAFERVEEAMVRIMRTKAGLQKPGKKEIDYNLHERLSCLLSEMSVSLIKDTPGVLPVQADAANVVFAGDRETYRSSPLMNHFLEISEVSERAGMPLSPGLDRAARRCDVTVFAIFTSVSAWKGSSGVGEEERRRIHDLIRKSGHSVVISFGSPYVLRHFGEADVLIAAYETTAQAQRATLECLEGRHAFRGKAPVRIDL